ncbi:tyrosine-type DNA invertase [Enterobacter chuandaensis]|uniref:tyrosine-type DNA invertase n=1 Tax=Enterobacter chuandaensis TaxID=2497875 RepID=UPI002075075D|nr:tyrosine-type DNA invertase [Enterobacter chuandaensis]MCM7587700.1 tyrosine-type DNA invertase [Enterobacter chuandaensis]
MDKRKHLTLAEIERLLSVVRQSKNAVRDECMILMCFFHGLRVSELTRLKLSDIDLDGGHIYIRRLKKGLCTMHPLRPEEAVYLRNWLSCRQRWKGADSGWLFLSRLGSALTRQHFYLLFKQYGMAAGLTIAIHPHMLRHACGYALADNGADTRLIQDYLGHKNIRHTVIYTAANAERFSGIWEKKTGKNLTFWPKLEFSIRKVSANANFSCVLH